MLNAVALIACLQVDTSRIIEPGTESPIGGTVRKIALRTLTEMSRRPQKLPHSRDVLVLAADHTSCYAPPALYQTSTEPHRLADFRELARSAISMMLPGDRYRSWSDVLVTFSDHVGAIIYELFHNTHEWARSEVGNRPVLHSIRGVLFRLRTPEAALSESDPALDYMTKFSSSRKLGFLEISVFDSGPGLAKRWWTKGGAALPSDPSIQDEYAAVLSCMKYRASSSNSWTKGRGLNKVLRTLAAVEGFLSIRTGHLHVYRDFTGLSAFGRDALTEQNTLLNDWLTRGALPSVSSSVEGTLITMLAPVEY